MLLNVVQMQVNCSVNGIYSAYGIIEQQEFFSVL